MSDSFDKNNKLQKIYNNLNELPLAWSALASAVDVDRLQTNMASVLKDFALTDLSIIEELDKQYETIKTFAEQMMQIPKLNINLDTYTAITKFDTNSLMTALRISYPLGEYDYDMMARTLQNTLSRRADIREFKLEEDKIEISSIIEEIKEEYNRKEEISEAVSEEGVEVKTKKKITSDEVWKILNRIAIIVTILAGIHTLFSKIETNVNNTIIETNNYYINEMHIDAIYLNMFQYRIINQDKVIPRLKPDCSSRVTGHLRAGQVVQIFNKYKKWIQISWVDKSDNMCYGWIQNYKLTKFKNYNTKI